jgi:hypothetical protein
MLLHLSIDQSLGTAQPVFRAAVSSASPRHRITITKSLQDSWGIGLVGIGEEGREPSRCQAFFSLLDQSPGLLLSSPAYLKSHYQLALGVNGYMVPHIPTAFLLRATTALLF